MKINKSEERLKVSSDSESSPSTSIQMLRPRSNSGRLLTDQVNTSIQMLRPRSNSGRLLTDQVNTSSTISGVMVTVHVSFGRSGFRIKPNTIKLVFVASLQSMSTLRSKSKDWLVQNQNNVS